MALFTTAQTGNWNAGPTWVGGVVPPNADNSSTAAIADGHVVTLPDGTSVTIGASGATGTAAITINGTGRLIIGTTTGATLICRGDLVLGQTSTSRTAGFYALTINPGSILEFDASQATTPLSQTYVCGANQSTARDTVILISGTTSAHAVVRSNINGGNAYFSQRGFNTYLGEMDATYCDFLRIGDATNFFTDLTSLNFSLHNCTLTNCGSVNYGNNFPTNGIWSMLDTKFIGSLNSFCVRHYTYTNAIGTGTREVKRCIFDKFYGGTGGTSCDLLDFTIQHCVFEGGVIFNSRTWALFDSCVVRKTVSVDTITAGSMSNIYWLCDFPDTNPHFFQVSDVIGATFDGLLFEYTGSLNDGDGIGLNQGSPASLLRHTIKNCVVLPRSGDGAKASCTLTTHAASANQQWADIQHNTVMGSDLYEHGVQLNETTATPVGAIPLYRSNIYWDTSARGNHFNTVVRGTPNNDTVTASGCTNNCAYNAINAPSGTPTEAPAGYGNSIGKPYNTPMTVGTPGLNDVNVNPNFVDSTRNFAKWAVTQGQASTVAATLTLLRANPATNIPALNAWIKGGFAPRNAAIKTAAHDGTTIGAVAWVASIGPCYPAGIFAAGSASPPAYIG